MGMGIVFNLPSGIKSGYYWFCYPDFNKVSYDKSYIIIIWSYKNKNFESKVKATIEQYELFSEFIPFWNGLSQKDRANLIDRPQNFTLPEKITIDPNNISVIFSP